MNTRVILTIVLIFIIPTSLTGYIKVEFINPGEAQETEIVVQAPTEMPAENTSKPTEVPILKPTNIVGPFVTLFHERFNESKSHYGHDLNSWSRVGGFPSIISTTRSKNSVRYDTYVKNDWTGFDSNKGWFFQDEIVVLKGIFRVVEMENNGPAEVNLMLATQLPSGWITNFLCAYSIRPDIDIPEYHCRVGSHFPNKSSEVDEYSTSYIPVNYGEWHTTKILLNPISYEITFFLDDKVIGTYTPINQAELRNSKFIVEYGVSSFPEPNRIIYEFDDILLAKYP